MDIEQTVVEAISKLKIGSDKTAKYVIGVDVGATNTRVAVGDMTGEYVIISKFQASTVKQLINGIGELSGAVLKQMNNVHPSGVCLAIAGPVSDLGTKAEVTNYLGSTAERMIRVSDLPSSICPSGNIRFINDLESCCYGILALNHSNLLQEYFTPLWSNGTSDGNVKLTPLHQAVLAAGTGLGVGMLIKLGAQNFQVYPLEYGHNLLTSLGKNHPDYELEQKLLNYLSETLYGGKYAAEYEDIVSGRGVQYVYEFLVKDVPDSPAGLTTPEIVMAADTNPPNPYAVQALKLHYKMLIRTAQSLAVGLQAKGVLLAGDNQVSNYPFVRSIAEDLKNEFLNHPKRHWIEQVPVYAQHKAFNINLFGTLFVARSLVNP